MILPEPKRTIPKDHNDAYLDFREVLRSLKNADQETYQKAMTVMQPEEWRAMLATLKEKNPEFYRRGTRLLRAAKAGLGDPEQVRQIARELEDGYKCDEGLTEAPPKRTVVVRLKHSEVITGLPKEIMRQSIALAKDFGGKRKWTFGFDNRAFTVDLEPAAIEELRKHPEVEEVEEAGEATILMANENPTYNPAGINTDWGVTRMPVAIPWGLTPPLYGAGIKVCVIDTGIGKDHQSFWKDGVCVFKGGWNFVAGNNNPADDHDHGCLSPDGLIYTSLGLETIESFWERFVAGEELEIDLSGKNIWTVALDTNSPAIPAACIKKVFKIPVNEDIVVVKTRSGLELKLTPWHPIFVFDGEKIVEKRADSLKDGDFLLRPAVNTLLPQQKQEVAGVAVDEDLAYALGLFLGDGFFRPAYKDSIGLSNTDPEVGRKFLKICKPLATSTGVAKDKRTGAGSYLAYGKRLYQLMRQLTDLPEGIAKTYNLAIPLVISRSPASVIGAFLAGYLDTDGHVSGRVNTVIWSTVSRDMADQLTFLLSLLGIKAHLVICKAKRTNEVDCYQITMAGIEEVRKLYQLIIPHLTSDQHRKRLEKIIARSIPWNVRNTGVPLASETINLLRAETKSLGAGGGWLKGSKDRRSAKGPAKYRLMAMLARMGESKATHFYRNLIQTFHFDQVVSVKRQPFQGYFYDLNVEGHHNYLAGNFGATFIHNTYCCSIVAGQHNGIAGSYRGIAPGVELYAVKVLDSKGSGSMANVAAGIDWARENGMHIINLSLGGPGATVLQQACDAAWYAGCLLVAAAGNSGPGDNTVAWPAAYLSVIAVAAVDFEEYVADFSSRGPQVEVAAPGRKITGALMGFTYKSYAVPGSGDRYFTASGTSAACPHVAAAAALIKNWYPLATNLELRTLIREHLRDI